MLEHGPRVSLSSIQRCTRGFKGELTHIISSRVRSCGASNRPEEELDGASDKPSHSRSGGHIKFPYKARALCTIMMILSNLCIPAFSQPGMHISYLGPRAAETLKTPYLTCENSTRREFINAYIIVCSTILIFITPSVECKPRSDKTKVIASTYIICDEQPR